MTHRIGFSDLKPSELAGRWQWPPISTLAASATGFSSDARELQPEFRSSDCTSGADNSKTSGYLLST
jgi:hypothetical protein